MACLTPYLAHGFPVPCGKCPKCLIRRASDWIFRLSFEDRKSVSTQFITLTYDSHCLPISPNGLPTLEPLIVQSFFKRLRSHHYRQHPDWPPIKYYAAGEYGGLRRRPHYHAIVTNCDPDLVQRSWVGNRNTDLSGVILGAAYLDPRPFDKAAIGYVTGYMHKPKIVGFHPLDDRVKERAWQSTKLGIDYLTDSAIRHHLSSPVNSGLYLDGGVRSALPRYYAKRAYACLNPQRPAANALFRDVSELHEYRCESCVSCVARQAYLDHAVQSQVDAYRSVLNSTFNGDVSKYIHYTHEARLAYTDNFFKRSSNRMDL